MIYTCTLHQNSHNNPARQCHSHRLRMNYTIVCRVRVGFLRNLKICQVKSSFLTARVQEWKRVQEFWTQASLSHELRRFQGVVVVDQELWWRSQVCSLQQFLVSHRATHVTCISGRAGRREGRLVNFHFCSEPETAVVKEVVKAIAVPLTSWL